MESIVEQARRKLAVWLENHRHIVLYDEANAALLDVSSGKSTRLLWARLQAFEEKIHPETGDTYLVFLFDDGGQLALVDPGGVAFAPSIENSGPLQNVPAVVCLRDFFTLKARVDHYLYEHPDEPPPRETLDMVMACVAILDGARAVGFDIGDLEEALETSLREIERRAA